MEKSKSSFSLNKISLNNSESNHIIVNSSYIIIKVILYVKINKKSNRNEFSLYFLHRY